MRLKDIPIWSAKSPILAVVMVLLSVQFLYESWNRIVNLRVGGQYVNTFRYVVVCFWAYAVVIWIWKVWKDWKQHSAERKVV